MRGECDGGKMGMYAWLQRRMILRKEVLGVDGFWGV